MCLLVGRLITPLLIVSVNQVIDGRTIANENIVFSFHIRVQICIVICYVEIYFSPIKHRLQFSRLIILDEQKKKQKILSRETIVGERETDNGIHL